MLTPRVARWLALTLGVGGASSVFVVNIDAADLGWHLAAGREIWRLGGLPQTDPFSFTASKPWMNHEWLWDVAAWALHATDPQLLAVANLAVLALTFALAASSALRWSGAIAASVLATWLAAANAQWFFDIRPHLLTLLLTALVLRLREHRLAPYAWPVIAVVWCNVHSGYLFGLGLMGLHALAQTLAALREPGRRSSLVLPWLGAAAALVALGVNPWGYHLLDFVLSYAPGQARSLFPQEIIEWQPIGWDGGELAAFGPLGWLTTFRGRYLVLCALALPAALARLRRDPYLPLVFVTTVLMALSARRFIALSAVVSVPLLAVTLGHVAKALAARVPPRPSLQLAPIAALVIATVALLHDVRWFPDLRERWTRHDTQPAAAVRYLNALGTPRRVLNYEVWGGYLMLHAPGARVFFDGRDDTVYDEQVYRDYLALMSGDARVPALLAKYRPDAALLPPRSAAAQALVEQHGFRAMYQDRVAVLLLPASSPLLTRALPSPDTVLAAQPTWWQRKAQLAAQRGEVQRALGLLQRALALDPLAVSAYADLIDLLGRSGQPWRAREAKRLGCAQAPVRCPELAYHEGLAWQEAGEPARALRSYREALLGHPLDPQLALRARITALVTASPR